MIKFEALSKNEASDIQKSNSELSSAETNDINLAKDFADGLFEKSPEELHNDMLREILDFDEDDCQFYFDATDKAIAEVLSEVRENWDILDDKGKKKLCERFAGVLADKLEIENPPKCKFYFDEEEGNYGFYLHDDNTINLNTKYFTDANETINTLAHEVRHSYQNHRAAKGETYIDELYKCNLENYIGLEFVDGYCVNFWEYQNQFVEVEARAFADLFKV